MDLLTGCLVLQARDPIPQFRNFVLKQSILSEAQIKDIDNEVEALVDEAVKFADESPKPVSYHFPNEANAHLKMG